MLVDKLLELADNQALSGAAATDNVVDFVQEAPTTGLDHGRLWMIFKVAEDVTGTLTCKIQDCDTEDGEFADAAASAAVDSPTAGTIIAVPMPAEHKRYVRGYMEGASGGTINVVITWGFDQNKPFKQADSIQALY